MPNKWHYEQIRGIALKPKKTFVVLSMNREDAVAICVCDDEVIAELIVKERRKVHKDYCWYQKVDVIS